MHVLTLPNVPCSTSGCPQVLSLRLLCPHLAPQDCHLLPSLPAMSSECPVPSCGMAREGCPGEVCQGTLGDPSSGPHYAKSPVTSVTVNGMFYLSEQSTNSRDCYLWSPSNAQKNGVFLTKMNFLLSQRKERGAAPESPWEVLARFCSEPACCGMLPLKTGVSTFPAPQRHVELRPEVIVVNHFSPGTGYKRA